MPVRTIWFIIKKIYDTRTKAHTRFNGNRQRTGEAGRGPGTNWFAKDLEIHVGTDMHLGYVGTILAKGLAKPFVPSPYSTLRTYVLINELLCSFGDFPEASIVQAVHATSS